MPDMSNLRHLDLQDSKNRETRNLEHLKSSHKSLSDGVPSLSSMSDGEERFAIVSGVLYLYVKQRGELWRFTGTKV